ncbi:hypothetical protein [Bosea sp. PAMC 26642]|uniref:hypothetical protein n=1 Tax=Bosea sp. (strain PAMC 26642) TaxID=1792307 RepID=UPI0007701BF0|nr:hypothetical protein [Bosea sp. PAMC 26642]AMJ62772.1 hypothetical protein AXW83_22955 [Bosea sp. PAMC 26642]
MTMPDHLVNDIKVGDLVMLSFSFSDRSGAGYYEILRILPPAMDGELQYRVRGDDGRERAIGLKQIHRTSPRP